MKAGSTIPETTLYADEAPAGLLVPPTNAQFHAGTEPEMTLPAAWWNYFVKLFTDTNIKAKSEINNIFTELAGILTAAGLTPSDLSTNQVITALNILLELRLSVASFNTAAAHNEFEYKSMSSYAQGDTVYTISAGTIKSVYIRTSASPATITGIAPTDTTHWARVYLTGTRALSNINRVMQLNGDGVPTFPDNVAGTVYKSNFSTTDGWGGINGGVVTAQDGYVRITVSNGTYSGILKSITIDTANVKNVRIKYRYVSGVSDVNFQWYDDTTYTTVLLAASTEKNGTWQYADIPVATNAEWNGIVSSIYIQGSVSATFVIDIADIYIGSGLYDTPVYGKDGQTVATNYGAVPVNGPRGKGLRFQRYQFIELDHQIGNNGCVHFIYDRSSTGINEYIFSDNDFNTSTGKGIFISDGQQLYFAYGNGSTNNTIPLVYDVIADGIHSYVVNLTPTTIGPVFRDGVLVQGQLALTGTIVPSTQLTRIGAGSSVYGGSDRLYGDLADIGFRSSPMTQDDVTRYHNGDDAVDSQQKSSEGAPHALVTYNSRGRINGTADLVTGNESTEILAVTSVAVPWYIPKGLWFIQHVDVAGVSNYIQCENAGLWDATPFILGGLVLSDGLSYRVQTDWTGGDVSFRAKKYGNPTGSN